MNSHAIFNETPVGLAFTIKASPNARQTLMAGLQADLLGRDMIIMKVAAPPVDGAANKAITDYFSNLLRLQNTAVQITSGHHAPIKRILIDAGDQSHADIIANALAD